LLPRNQFDEQVDQESINKTKQLFEKMISGFYLGEISRVALVNLIKSGALLAGRLPALLKEKHALETSVISQFQSDNSPNLAAVEKIFLDKFQATTTLQDRRAVKELCFRVAQRAARLSGTAILAVLTKMNRLTDVSVAVDGSVFEHYPGFRRMMEEIIAELAPQARVQLVLTKDGSGVGAAIIAATTAAAAPKR
jgi:hexokinase